MSNARPVPLPIKHRLYMARRKSGGMPIALVEARDDAEAATRVAYVIGELGLAEWQEIEVQPAQAYQSMVPMFLDGFFDTRKARSTNH